MTRIGLGVRLPHRHGRGTGFQPTKLAGLLGWWRADLGTTVATGVSAWADQSGNGFAMTQGTGSSQPTLVAAHAALNNQAALSFDLTDSFAVDLDSVTAKDYTVFFVIDPTSGTGRYDIYDATGDDRLVLSHRISGANNPGYYNGLWRDSLVAASADAQALSFVLDSATGGDVYVDGVQIGATLSFASALTISVAILPKTRPDTMVIAEVIFYSRVLSATERGEVDAYLAARYGL